MAVQPLIDVRAYWGGLDATPQQNQVDLEAAVVALDATTMGSQGWMTPVGGLKGAKIGLSGFVAYGATPGLDQVNDRLFADLGGAAGAVAQPFSMFPTSGAVGSPCYVGSVLETELTEYDKVGNLAPFALSGKLSGRLGAGFGLHPQGTPRIVTGVGAGVQFTPLGAGQSMILGAHCLSMTGSAGPTLAITVQSATTNAFTGPTTRATFTTFSAVGGQVIVVGPGAITDTWWRVSYVITGTSPSFLFAATAGIA